MEKALGGFIFVIGLTITMNSLPHTPLQLYGEFQNPPPWIAATAVVTEAKTVEVVEYRSGRGKTVTQVPKVYFEYEANGEIIRNSYILGEDDAMTQPGFEELKVGEEAGVFYSKRNPETWQRWKPAPPKPLSAGRVALMVLGETIWAFFGVSICVVGLARAGLRVPLLADALFAAWSTIGLAFKAHKRKSSEKEFSPRCLLSVVLFVPLLFLLDPNARDGSSQDGLAITSSFYLSLLAAVIVFGLPRAWRRLSTAGTLFEADSRAQKLLNPDSGFGNPQVKLDPRTARYSTATFAYGGGGCVVIPVMWLALTLLLMLGSGSKSAGGGVILFTLTLSVVAYLAVPVAFMAIRSRPYREKMNQLQATRQPAMETLAESLGMSYQKHANPMTTGEESDRELLTLWRSVHCSANHVIRKSGELGPVVCYDHHDYMGFGPFALANARDGSTVDFTVIAYRLRQQFPDLVVYPEEVLDKIVKRSGGLDIDLDSVEFSDEFRVWSKDKRFAYAVLSSQTMEFLKTHAPLSLRIHGNAVSIAFPNLAEPGTISEVFDRLEQLDWLVPEFVRSDHENEPPPLPNDTGNRLP